MHTGFHPSTVMLIPSAGCPAECSYCFSPRGGGVMPASVLDASARLIRDELWRGKRAGKITFHGGEPLVAGVEWFAYALKVLSEATHRYAGFSMQSNLWLLDDRFVDLLAEYRVGISTSLDGGQEICDGQRGAGYFEKTMAGVNLLRRNGLEVSAIATVLPENLDKIQDIIAFFDTEGIPFTLHAAEPSYERGYVNYLPDSEVGQMYYSVLDYMEHSPAPSRIRDVEAIIKNVFSKSSSLCTFSDCLGRYAAIDTDGSVYTCQRFCGKKEFCLGTVNDSADAMSDSAAYKRFVEVRETAKQSCAGCRHFSYCNGGCTYSVLVAKKYSKPWPRCNDAEPAGRVYRDLFDHATRKLAGEAAGIMLNEETPTPYLAAAGDRPHPVAAAQGRERYRRALEWGKVGAPRHTFTGKRGAQHLFLNITNNCPLRCSHCAVKASSGHEDMPRETALAIVREATALGFREVSLNGGEPFLYREFGSLVGEMAKFRDANMRFTLFTSLFLDFDDYLAALILQTFDRISVSLDGGETEHDAVRGEGSFVRTCGHIQRLIELNHKLGTPCTIAVRASLTQAQRARGVSGQIREAVNALGIGDVDICNVLPIGRAKPEDMAELDIPAPPKPEDRFFSSFFPRDSCGLCSSPHITPEGDVYPCWAYLEDSKPLGNVREGLKNVLYDYLWGSRKNEYCVDSSEKCQNCDVRYLCGGVCYAYKDSNCEALRSYYLTCGRR